MFIKGKKVGTLLLVLVLIISVLNPFALFAKTVSVRGYYRKDGTYVRPHYRTSPNSTKSDNWSTIGNINPYTGEYGTINPYGSGSSSSGSYSGSSSSSSSSSSAIKKYTYKYSNKKVGIGSTKQDVVDYLGTPDSIDKSTWGYGQVFISFNNDGMVRSFNTKINDLPSVPRKIYTSPTALTLGSEKSEVVDTLGIPDSISGKKWCYGNSNIVFDANGYMVGFTNLAKDINISMSEKISTAAAIIVGSTKQEVLNAMGTPDTVNQTHWYYQDSYIIFGKDDKVQILINTGKNLKVS